MNSWYSIKNKTDGVLDLSIHDEIGFWGVTASEFIKDLQSHKNVKSVNLSIHSPGGSMLDGFAMHNALSSFPAKIYGHVTGVAASAASLVLMASDVISMPEDAFIMVHNPHGVVMGGSDDMRDYADLMDKLSNSAVNIYSKRTGIDGDTIKEMLNSETWMNGKDAIDNGFADTLTDAVGVASKIGQFNRYFKSMPVEPENNIENLETIKDFERYLRDSGNCSRSAATKLASKAKAIFQSDSALLPDADYKELETALMQLKVPKSLL